VGSFGGSVDFGSGARISVGELYNGFAAAFDGDGGPLWDRVFGGDSSLIHPDVQITRVATDDAGRVVLLGSSNGYVEQKDGTYTSDARTFLVGIDDSGAQAWERPFVPGKDVTSNAVVTPTALATTPGGDVFVGGTVWQPPPPPSPDPPVHTAFLARLSPGGEPRWTATYALSADSAYGEDQINAIETDGCTVTLAGNAGAIDFGGGPLGASTAATAFVAQLKGDGHFIRGAAFGGAYSTISTLAVGRDHVAVGGVFEGTMELPGSTIDSGGAYQAFAAVLGP
jgi:hypothetical protein